jgi:hypothetical protein
MHRGSSEQTGHSLSAENVRVILICHPRGQLDFPRTPTDLGRYTLGLGSSSASSPAIAARSTSACRSAQGASCSRAARAPCAARTARIRARRVSWWLSSPRLPQPLPVDQERSAGPRAQASDANTSPTPSKSPRLKAALARLAASTFSCDIGYSRSPAASRASLLLPKTRQRASEQQPENDKDDDHDHDDPWDHERRAHWKRKCCWCEGHSYSLSLWGVTRRFYPGPHHGSRNHVHRGGL